jgi:purine-binding chemotaxis protein CheW
MHDESKIGKFIVFRIADYLLALPIYDVLKVVDCSLISSSGLRTMGVVQLGQHMIRVLDLERQFNSNGLSELTENRPFLVIIRGPQGELCGIAVDRPPNLVEFPLELIQSLPKSNYQSPAMELVSHAAVVSLEKATTTIFLLDTQRFLNATINDSPPLYLNPS